MLEFLFELVFEAIFQLIVELGFEVIAEPFRRRPRLGRIVGLIGIALLGALIGLVLSNFLPTRILPQSKYPGISLILSPLAAGLAMKTFGDWRRSRGAQPTVMASFWGGALFAFSMSLVRWFRVG